MNRNFRRLQAGFTLIEALVVLAIIALIAVISMTAFDGARSKAQTLIAVMGQTAGAAQQFRTDVGSYPTSTRPLFSNTTTAATEVFSGAATWASRWERPYMAKQKMNAAGTAIVMDKVGAGVELNIARAAGGLGQIYYVSATNVPADIVTAALRECNSDTGADIAISAANLNANKCVGVAGNGTFAMVFDQTR